MKITRLRHGYRIKATDSEFKTLQAAIGALAPKTLAGDAKRAFTKRTSGGEFLRIDNDRRAGGTSAA